jgi:hypothetical protein
MKHQTTVAARIDTLVAADVRAWLHGRMIEARDLAKKLKGADRKEWMEDEAFYAAAIGLIDWTAAEICENETQSQQLVVPARTRLKLIKN